MKLKIDRVADKGDISNERLIISVERDADSGEYILLVTGFSNGLPNIVIEHSYWFPDQNVESGDIIVVYSKRGLMTQRKRKNGSTAYFFYIGSDGSIWSEETKAAVLLHAPEWEAIGARDL